MNSFTLQMLFHSTAFEYSLPIGEYLHHQAFKKLTRFLGVSRNPRAMGHPGKVASWTFCAWSQAVQCQYRVPQNSAKSAQEGVSKSPGVREYLLISRVAVQGDIFGWKGASVTRLHPYLWRDLSRVLPTALCLRQLFVQVIWDMIAMFLCARVSEAWNYFLKKSIPHSSVWIATIVILVGHAQCSSGNVSWNNEQDPVRDKLFQEYWQVYKRNSQLRDI